MNTFPVFKFQIDKYMILDTDKANQLLFVHLIAHVSVQNYANFSIKSHQIYLQYQFGCFKYKLCTILPKKRKNI